MSRHPQELTYPVKGEWLTLKELSAKYNVRLATLKYRHYHLGWEGDDLVQPTHYGSFNYKGKVYGRHSLSKLLGISPSTLLRRWAAGLREDDLAKETLAPKKRKMTQILDELVAKTGLSRQTLGARYRKGERGAFLERPLEDSRQQKRDAVNRRWAKVRKEQEAKK